MNIHDFNAASYNQRNEVPSASVTNAKLKEAGCDSVYPARAVFDPLDPQNRPNGVSL